MSCAHCGLALRRRVVVATVDGEDQRFCCYGCALALQITRARGEEGAAATILVRLGLAIFFAMNVMMVSLPTYAPHVYGDAAIGSGAPLIRVLQVLAMAFAAPVLVLLGAPIAAAALRGARQGGLAADALIVLGVVAAFGLSALRVVHGDGPVYFDTAVMVLVLVTLGRYLEAQARAAATAAVRSDLVPGGGVARLVEESGERRAEVAALRPGQIVRVLPGEAFPSDATVIAGKGWVDEAALTGENRPVAKTLGSEVFGGTLSVDGGFAVRLRCAAGDSAAARIAELVAAASRERSHAERAADRVAQVFLPLVIAIALGTALWWALHGGVDRGILTGLSVLVVACPCALGLATPLAVWLGLAAAARRGIVVRSAAALERAAEVGCVLFDKTGTLTDRLPALRAVAVAPGCGFDRDEVLALAAALETGLVHPLARSIEAAFHAERGAAARPPAVSDLRTAAGRGVSGVVGGAHLYLGSPLWAAAEGVSGWDVHPGAAPPGVLLWADGRMLGALYFEEQMRPEAGAALRRLRRAGISVRLLSGDHSAAAVVPALLREDEVEVGLLPEDKLRRVRELRAVAPAQRLAVVGDGLNDAPALAAADFGIAFGDCVDLTRSAADAVVLAADLERVPWLLQHARRVMRVVRQNLFWAFAYNTVAVVAAASGRLTPLLASLTMLVSSLAVVANARRLSARAGKTAGLETSFPLWSGSTDARFEGTQVAGLAHDHEAVADLGADVGGGRKDHLAAGFLDGDHEHAQLLAKL